MGDMADWVNDQTDNYYLDHFEEWGQSEQTCKYCKRWPFWWLKTDEGWRLSTETGRIHKCKAYERRMNV